MLIYSRLNDVIPMLGNMQLQCLYTNVYFFVNMRREIDTLFAHSMKFYHTLLIKWTAERRFASICKKNQNLTLEMIYLLKQREFLFDEPKQSIFQYIMLVSELLLA